ncbi:MAG: DNA starvation/stationary phase protection protein [Zhengella sp.]|uniref:Dps family protein n=1 Tax=Zhengella sp. TaxID=2282762 RepID=UPI001DDCDD99|nr:DNA starvation/stationary phase protection protein [Notoacmeibacter sp.]MCC0025756.1 DNA starvation/stationary phase protection protein [Brucellaceae bacterium]
MSNVTAVLKPEAHAEKINIGLSADYCKEMSGLLTGILEDTYRLTVKSHVYHWNVVGPLFKPLHELTEDHYEELFAAADTIAERIRALGHLAPVSFAETSHFAPGEKSVDHSSAKAMVEDLIETHEKAVRTMREAAGKAGDAGDVVTEDMLTQRLTFHEKALWMMRAIVAD